jgi:hypothetical protein
MSQALQQARPERSRARMSPATAGTVPLNAGFTTVGPRPAYGGRGTGAGRSARVIAWRPRAQQAPFRQRLVAWRERYWRRVVLAWFVLSMIIVMAAAEPSAYFPKAQTRSVPAVQTLLRVAGGLTVAGVPVLLIALP